jgi:hypothetical protein
MIPLSEAAQKPASSAMSADMKSRLAEIKRRAAAEPRTPSRPPSAADPAADPEELTDDELGRMFEEQHKEEQHKAESKIKKAQSVLSTPKPRISARDVDGEGYLSDDAESRTASSDQRRRAESRMARRGTMKPNNIGEVNRRQIDRDISRPGSRANIAHGRKVKSGEQASEMKTKGDLPTPVPPDPYRGGEETRAQRDEVQDRSIAREESAYREGQARRQHRISRGADPEELDWDGSYYDD